MSMGKCSDDLEDDIRQFEEMLKRPAENGIVRLARAHRALVSRAYEAGQRDASVKWIVTEGNDPDVCANGEFGVEVNGKAYIYYKWPEPSASDSDVKYRVINKREFGETITRDSFRKAYEMGRGEAIDEAAAYLRDECDSKYLAGVLKAREAEMVRGGR